MTQAAPQPVPSSSRKAKAPNDYFLTIGETAYVLGISRSTVLREIERGRLTCAHELSLKPKYTRRKFLAEHLLAYCRKHGSDLLVLHVEQRIAEKLAA